MRLNNTDLKKYINVFCLCGKSVISGSPALRKAFTKLFNLTLYAPVKGEMRWREAIPKLTRDKLIKVPLLLKKECTENMNISNSLFAKL